MIGTKIKELRKQQGLSLKDLSEQIDVSVSFLSDIENNRSNPSLDRIKDIAKGLNTSVSYLLDEHVNLPDGYEMLTTDKIFFHVAEILTDFPSWSDEDKNELLTYLKAKKVIRDYKD